MKANDSFCLDIDAEVARLPEVITFLNEYLQKLSITKKELAQIRIVEEEIFVNIAEYAYKPDTGKVSVSGYISEDDNSISITFIDSGERFDPLQHEDPDIKAQQRIKGGMGILYVKKKVDDIRYSYEDGKNKLTILKKFRKDDT